MKKAIAILGSCGDSRKKVRVWTCGHGSWIKRCELFAKNAVEDNKKMSKISGSWSCLVCLSLPLIIQSLKLTSEVHLELNSLCCSKSQLESLAQKHSISSKYLFLWQCSKGMNKFLCLFCRSKSVYSLPSSYNSLPLPNPLTRVKVIVAHFLLRFSQLPEDKATISCDDLLRSK